MRIPSLWTWLGLGLALASSAIHAQTSTELCRLPTPAEATRFTNPVKSPGIVSPIDGTCWVPSVTVTSFDGTKLAVNLFLPRRTSAAQVFPTILMISSWGNNGLIEYLGEQQRFAKDGYVVGGLTPRGFGASEGVAHMAASEDLRDISSVIDWLLANAPVDPNNIGTSGISYGAGLSLLAISHDPRIKTVAALSGWNMLIDQMYTQGSSNVTWGPPLAVAGSVSGKVGPEVSQIVADLVNPNTSAARIAEIQAWGKLRSPVTYVDAINARNAPVFISKNYQDDLLTPNSSMDLFAKLTGPKKLLLNPGPHAVPEILGAQSGISTYAYDEAHRWFDYWLKGLPNGVDAEPKVMMQVKFSDRRETLTNWPAPELESQTYYLGPRGLPRFDPACLCSKGDKGSLSSSPNTVKGSDLIQNFSDTTATSGPIPIVSTIGESVDLPVVNSLTSVALATGVRFEGPTLQRIQQIRGIPKLNLRITPSQAHAQVVAYLYDVDAIGTGVLITHGASTLHWAAPGQPVDLPLDFSAIAYDVPAGHHIGVVFDTMDSLYGSPVNPGERFGVSFEFSPERQATLELPTR